MTSMDIRKAFKEGTLMDAEGNPVTDKDEMYQMAYLADLKKNPAKFAYGKGGTITHHLIVSDDMRSDFISKMNEIGLELNHLKELPFGNKYGVNEEGYKKILSDYDTKNTIDFIEPVYAKGGYVGDYYSSTEFVEKHNLQNKAKKLFGNEWEQGGDYSFDNEEIEMLLEDEGNYKVEYKEDENDKDGEGRIYVTKYAKGGKISESDLRKRFESYSDFDLQVYNGDNEETLKNWNREDAIDEAVETAIREWEDVEGEDVLYAYANWISTLKDGTKIKSGSSWYNTFYDDPKKEMEKHIEKIKDDVQMLEKGVVYQDGSVEKESFAKGGNVYIKQTYRVWVGGTEDAEGVSYEEAKAIAREWYDKGYDDVIIEDEISGEVVEFAKGGMVKKSDFTMLGAGLLIGGLFAYFRK